MRLQTEGIWGLNLENAFTDMSGALDGDSWKADLDKDDRKS